MIFLRLVSFTWDVVKVHPCCSSMCRNFTPFYDQITFHCMDRAHLVFSFSSWWTFGLLPRWGLLGMMLLSTFLYKFLCGCVFVCLGSGIAGSCDNSVFSHWRNCQIALQSICTILHLQRMRVPVFNYFLSRLSGSVYALPSLSPFMSLLRHLQVLWYFSVSHWPVLVSAHLLASPLQNRALSFFPHSLYLSYMYIFFSFIHLLSFQWGFKMY